MICAKTKLKIVDVEDMLAVMPQCLAEAFIVGNPAERTLVNFGAFSAQWRQGSRWGPYITFKPTKPFKLHLTKLRYERKHPLASRLYDMMNAKTKERVLAKAARGGYNNTS